MLMHNYRSPPSVTSTAMLAHDRRLLVVLQATLLVPVQVVGAVPRFEKSASIGRREGLALFLRPIGATVVLYF